MSSRRSRPTRQSGSSRITEEQINDLVSKLQAVLPEARLRSNDRASASKVLQETCNYIRSLHREVDDLSERLSELLETTETISSQADIIRSLLMSTRIEAAVPSPLDCLAYSFMVGCRLPSAN